MVEHVRKAIRAAAVTDITGLATTGANVFTSRLSPLEAVEMPGWYVMVRDETADEDDAMGTFGRTGRLIFEGWAVGDDGLEDLLDRMAAEVESAIYDPTGAVMALLQNFGAPTTQVEMPQPDAGTAERIGKIRILIPVTYRTAMANPTTIV